MSNVTPSRFIVILIPAVNIMSFPAAEIVFHNGFNMVVRKQIIEVISIRWKGTVCLRNMDWRTTYLQSGNQPMMIRLITSDRFSSDALIKGPR